MTRGSDRGAPREFTTEEIPFPRDNKLPETRDVICSTNYRLCTNYRALPLSTKNRNDHHKLEFSNRRDAKHGSCVIHRVKSNNILVVERGVAGGGVGEAENSSKKIKIYKYHFHRWNSI